MAVGSEKVNVKTSDFPPLEICHISIMLPVQALQVFQDGQFLVLLKILFPITPVPLLLMIFTAISDGEAHETEIVRKT
jgi:hypothetical protein